MWPLISKYLFYYTHLSLKKHLMASLWPLQITSITAGNKGYLNISTAILPQLSL